MNAELLFLKDQIVREQNLDLIFHKDYPHIYNIEPLPIVKFTLVNFLNVDLMCFENIDYYNDGVTIGVEKVGDRFIFEISSMADEQIKIICDKVIKEELEYRKEDFIYLIKEISNQRDEAYDSNISLQKRLDNLEKWIKKEIENSYTKLDQANWLSSDKKHSLKAELSNLNKIISILELRIKEV